MYVNNMEVSKTTWKMSSVGFRTIIMMEFGGVQFISLEFNNHETIFQFDGLSIDLLNEVQITVYDKKWR